MHGLVSTQCATMGEEIIKNITTALIVVMHLITYVSYAQKNRGLIEFVRVSGLLG